jgi:ring-1,2-phenylacetyl-CoA epoxidase subunit PaaE
MSILTTGLNQEPNSNFVLVFGNQSSSETMFFRELQNLKEQYPNRLTIHYLFSRSNEEGALFGRIENSTVNYILKNKHKDLTFDAFYLCGPEGMIQSVQEALTQNAIDAKTIHYELFTTSTDDAEINSVDIPEGKTQVSGVVDDEAFSFVMDASDRVLDAALENDVDAPYSCQGGICSSCIARVKEGSIEMVKNQILTDAELAEGLILTCQSHPTSKTLVIDYDDV